MDTEAIINEPMLRKCAKIANDDENDAKDDTSTSQRT